MSVLDLVCKHYSENDAIIMPGYIRRPSVEKLGGFIDFCVLAIFQDGLEYKALRRDGDKTIIIDITKDEYFRLYEDGVLVGRKRQIEPQGAQGGLFDSQLPLL